MQWRHAPETTRTGSPRGRCWRPRSAADRAVAPGSNPARHAAARRAPPAPLRASRSPHLRCAVRHAVAAAPSSRRSSWRPSCCAARSCRTLAVPACGGVAPSSTLLPAAHPSRRSSIAPRRPPLATLWRWRALVALTSCRGPIFAPPPRFAACADPCAARSSVAALEPRRPMETIAFRCISANAMPSSKSLRSRV